MKNHLVDIDFDKLRKAFREYVREKANKAGSTIVYMKDGQLIEEDPRTLQKKILKSYVDTIK